MSVPSKMSDLYTLPASNSPSGSDAIGNSLDDYLRSGFAITRSTNALSSVTISAGSTVDLGTSDAESVYVTGSATIGSFGTSVLGLKREIRFASSCTITHSSNILCPNATSYTTAAGEVVSARCTASGVWTITAVSSPAISAIQGLQTALNGKATDSSVVHLTGTETINGGKTFSAPITSATSLNVAGSTVSLLLHTATSSNYNVVQIDSSAAGAHNWQMGTSAVTGGGIDVAGSLYFQDLTASGGPTLLQLSAALAIFRNSVSSADYAVRITNTATNGYSTLQLGDTSASLSRNGSSLSNAYGPANTLFLNQSGANPINFVTNNTLRGGVDGAGKWSFGNDVTISGQVISSGSNAVFMFYDRSTSLEWDLYASAGVARIYNATNGSIATYSVSGDFTLTIAGREFYRANANSATQTRQPRTFVQSGDPGAAAADGDLWVW